MNAENIDSDGFYLVMCLMTIMWLIVLLNVTPSLLHKNQDSTSDSDHEFDHEFENEFYRESDHESEPDSEPEYTEEIFCDEQPVR